MATDWTALKLEYVHGTDTMRSLADKHKIKAAGVMARAVKEGWDVARKQEQAKASTIANASLGDLRAIQLAEFNEADLKMAKNLRAMVTKQIQKSQGDLEPAQIRALAGAASEAQRIGRLALGAETENTKTEVTQKDGVLVIGSVMSPDDWEKAAKAQQAELIKDNAG